jgi:uncharacterized cofD-like protein
MKINKWLYPGMGVKRWISLSVFGTILFGFGMVFLFSKKFFAHNIIGWFLVVAGGILIIYGMKSMVGKFVSVFLPERKEDLVDIVYSKRNLGKGPKITVIGGGHGLSALLQGIKKYTGNIKAIVTVADDGGSSGRLREEFDVLPPGDIRNCLVALAEAEPLMRELFQFRFTQGEGLKGHNFGNLFITALSEISGDFRKAVKHASKILAVRGQVIPSTLERIRLIAEHGDGDTTFGEHNIPKRGLPIKRVHLSPRNFAATHEAIKAVEESDIIILGPGSLYTSVIPNLLVQGIADAVFRTDGIKIYVCNVMTQPGETDGYTASDHLKTIINHTYPGIIDFCVLNNSPISKDLLEKYVKENSQPVKIDIGKFYDLKCKVVIDDVISSKDYVRHSPEKLAKCIMEDIIVPNLKERNLKEKTVLKNV